MCRFGREVREASLGLSEPLRTVNNERFSRKRPLTGAIP